MVGGIDAASFESLETTDPSSGSPGDSKHLIRVNDYGQDVEISLASLVKIKLLPRGHYCCALPVD